MIKILSFASLVVDLLLVSVIICIGCDACDIGWFGSDCQYLCHCDNSDDCDDNNGTCADGTCETGWFGPACQYVSSSYTADGGESWLFDDTCNDVNPNNVQPVTVSLDIPHLLTWLRIIVREPVDLDQIIIGYTDYTGATELCPSDQRARVDERTMDIACPSSYKATKIELSSYGVVGLCSLYVSGGRNVALRESATQSSTYEDDPDTMWGASNAVDGDNPHDEIPKEIRQEGCSHTRQSKNPWWKLSFGTRSFYLNRFNIWDRDDFWYRLDDFTLQTLDSQNQEVFSYTAGAFIQDYTVTVSNRSDTPVKTVNINLPGNDRTLELCELYIFGDIACEADKYGKECNNSCNCLNQAEACFVSTGGCPSGCALGYTGEDCYTPCLPGFYGSGCVEECSDHCVGDDNACSATDGVCELGCDPGYIPGRCDTPCSDGYYGQNCEGQCSDHCTTANRCDHVDGSCGCTDGYLPPLCKDVCAEGFYGYNCSNFCGEHCLGGFNNCDHVDGSCDRGCEAGYQRPLCVEECRDGTYGEACLSVCSPHCHGNNTTCDHINGTCVNGCNPGYQPPLCQENSQGVDAVVPAVIAVVVLMALVAVVVGVIIWRRRREKNTGQELSLSEQLPKSSCKDADPDSEDPTNIYWTLSDSSAVRVDDLKAYINKHAQGSFLKDQFESVPLKGMFTSADGMASSSQDASTVILKSHLHKSPKECVNASHIKGYRGNKGFIASEGPNGAVQNDFIRLIWDLNVSCIVMLTNAVENGKKKCNVYWSPEGELTFGEISVNLLATEVFAEYTVRYLGVYETKEKVREVTQFHFTAWPEQLVPDSPWGLVDFYQRVMAHGGDGPKLVHCSDGVGRTGAFVALCQLLQEAVLTGHMDFLTTLSRLRQDRESMVQTLDQYKFLHYAALVAHVTSGTRIPVRDLANRIKALEKDDGLSKEFQAIHELYGTETVGSDCLNNRRDRNVKNQLDDVLPKQAHHVTLSGDSVTADNYTNAVLVPTLRKSHQDILAQLPTPSAVTDFWRTVMQHQVGLIVAFEVDAGHRDKTIGRFLPSSDEDNFSHDNFTITMKVTEKSTMWQTASLTVMKKNYPGNKSEASSQLFCILVKSFELSSTSLYSVIKKIKSLQLRDEGRTLYACRDGATISGLMSVQSTLLDKLRAEQCLAVPLVVGAMKALRPQAIPTVVQYKLLYKVLQLEVDVIDNDDYAIADDTTTCDVRNTGKSAPGNVPKSMYVNEPNGASPTAATPYDSGKLGYANVKAAAATATRTGLPKTKKSDEECGAGNVYNQVDHSYEQPLKQADHPYEQPFKQVDHPYEQPLKQVDHPYEQPLKQADHPYEQPLKQADHPYERPF